MRQVLLIAILLGSLNPAAAAPQSPTPRFEVASIKLWSPPTTPVTRIVAVAAAPKSGGRQG